MSIYTTAFIFFLSPDPSKLIPNTPLVDAGEAHQKPSHITSGYLPQAPLPDTRE